MVKHSSSTGGGTASGERARGGDGSWEGGEDSGSEEVTMMKRWKWRWAVVAARVERAGRRGQKRWWDPQGCVPSLNWDIPGASHSPKMLIFTAWRR